MIAAAGSRHGTDFQMMRMMRFSLLFSLLLVGLATGCERRQDRSPAAADADNASYAVPSPAAESRDPAALLAWADSIDSLALRSDASEWSFSLGPDGLVALPAAGEPPSDAEAEIRILMGSDGRPLRHLEIPVSESGDWGLTLAHYFDPAGRTLVFASNGRYLGPPGCGPAPLRDIRRTVYAPDGPVVRTARELLDDAGQPVDQDECGHLYDFFAGEPRPTYEALVRSGLAPPL